MLMFEPTITGFENAKKRLTEYGFVILIFAIVDVATVRLLHQT